MASSESLHFLNLLESKTRDISQLSQYFLDLPFVQNFVNTQGISFFNRLVQYITYKIYLPTEVIIEGGKPVNALYIFMQGCVSKGISRKDKNFSEINEKQTIGEETFITRQSSKYSYIAVKQSVICYVLKDDFFRVIKKSKLAMSLINNLQHFPFFSELSPNFLEQIIQRSSTSIFLNHQIVYDQNETPQSWFIILKGAFELKFFHNNKYQSFLLLEDGDYFGELEIMKKVKRQFRIECISNESETLEITQQLFLQLLQKNIQFLKMIEENVENKIKQYQNMIFRNKITLNMQTNHSPIKPKYKFKSCFLRIKKKDEADELTIGQLYTERSNELKNLLNYRMRLIQKENQTSASEKIQQRNPRLKQFLDKLNKIKYNSTEKQKNSTEKNGEIEKSHRKLNTEVAFSSSARNSIGYLKSTFYSPQSSTSTNPNQTSPRISSKFYKLLFH